MGSLLTIAITILVILAVMVPVTGLATRGRRQLGRGGRGDGSSGRALPSAQDVDPDVRALHRASGELREAIEGLLALEPDYDRVIPMLEVMDGARSSPRVYPSNWIGELLDAYDATRLDCEAAAEAWLDAWSETSRRSRDELAERSGLEALREALRREPFDARAVKSNAFSYLSRKSLVALSRRAEALDAQVARVQAALREYRPSPYR